MGKKAGAGSRKLPPKQEGTDLLRYYDRKKTDTTENEHIIREAPYPPSSNVIDTAQPSHQSLSLPKYQGAGHQPQAGSRLKTTTFSPHQNQPNTTKRPFNTLYTNDANFPMSQDVDGIHQVVWNNSETPSRVLIPSDIKSKPEHATAKKKRLQDIAAPPNPCSTQPRNPLLNIANAAAMDSDKDMEDMFIAARYPEDPLSATSMLPTTTKEMAAAGFDPISISDTCHDAQRQTAGRSVRLSDCQTPKRMVRFSVDSGLSIPSINSLSSGGGGAMSVKPMVRHHCLNSSGRQGPPPTSSGGQKSRLNNTLFELQKVLDDEREDSPGAAQGQGQEQHTDGNTEYVGQQSNIKNSPSGDSALISSKMQQQLTLQNSNDAAGIAAAAAADRSNGQGKDCALKHLHATTVALQLPPRSPYYPGSNQHVRALSQDDVVRVFSAKEEEEAPPGIRADPHKNAAVASVDWGDSDEDDHMLATLEAVERHPQSTVATVAAAAAATTSDNGCTPLAITIDIKDSFTVKCEATDHRRDAADTAAQEVKIENIAASNDDSHQLPQFVGNRAVVYFTVKASWHHCPTSENECLTETRVRLYNPYSQREVIGHFRSPFDQLNYQPNDPLNLIVEHFDQFEGELHCIVGGGFPGMVVHFPDLLLAGTRVASAVTCTRRAFLEEQIAGEEGTADVCLKGTMYHSLFEWAISGQHLDKHNYDVKSKEIAAQHTLHLLDCGMSEREAHAYLLDSAPGIISWVKNYVTSQPQKLVPIGNGTEGDCKVGVTRVVDTEEYIVAPKFGLKGMIDASVELMLMHNTSNAVVKNKAFMLHGGSLTVMAPLELKSGRPRLADSTQVLLYLLAMEERYGKALNWGLLVYRNGNGTSTELVPRAEMELQSIMVARNRVAAAVSRNALPPLSELKNNCHYCYQRSLCMVTHAAHGGTGNSFVDTLPDCTTRSKLLLAYEQDAGHIKTKDEADFLRHWNRLIDLEAAASQNRHPEIWAMTGDEREALGRCLTCLTISGITRDLQGNGWLYTFVKRDGGTILCPFSPGEMLMLGLDGTLAGIARGHLFDTTETSVVVHLDKALRQGFLFPHGKKGERIAPVFTRATSAGYQNPKPASETGHELCDPSINWRLDKAEIATTARQMRGYLYMLFVREYHRDSAVETPSSQRAGRLRRLIVDLEAPRSPPAQAEHSVEEAIRAQCELLKLNSEQRNAVQRAVSVIDYTLVLGLPGAGKTTAIVAILRALAAIGKRVLLSSYTNSAVDNVLTKLARSGYTNFVRVGRKDRVHQDVHDNVLGSEKFPINTTSDLLHIVHTVPIVATSALGAGDALVRQYEFDVCVIDEAGQIVLPATLGPLLRAKSFVLVGDHHQLPPLVASKEAEQGGLAEPLFARLAAVHPGSVVTLASQYRMSKDIQILPNVLVYNGKLKCGSTTVADAVLHVPNESALASAPSWASSAFDPVRAVVFLDTSSVDHARETVAGEAVSNAGEASIVQQLVQHAVSAGISQESIGVISPYRHQVALMEQALRRHGMDKVDCLTIDKAQGQDKDCVIVSFVRSNEERHAGKLLLDSRRLNVAITRAKTKLILVGDCRTLSSLSLFKTLLSECERRNWMVVI